MRTSGILMHITSLPTPGGVGTLGREARAFADFLQRSGVGLWQVLPVGPTGYGESPYQSGSCFAGNPLLIDLEELAGMGLLTPEEAASMPEPANPERADFEIVRGAKEALLRRACARDQGDDQAFCRENPWAADYALFSALKRKFGGVSWMAWPDEKARMRDPGALSAYRAALSEDIRYEMFVQRTFRRQWFALREYCHARKIRLFGDMPIYAAEDSADVWTNPWAFRLDENRRPVRVAGVPPDYFSADGQLWGNPVYDWQALKDRGYSWWVDRMRAMAELFDLIRIDHFIGFANFYSIPAGAANARGGSWVRGPGRALFKTLAREVPQARIVAEDLGCLTGKVIRLRNFCGFPGMKVLQFAFGGGGDDSPLLPKNLPRNCVVYTGTHDNDTTMHWWREADEATRENCLKSVGPAEPDIAWAMIRAAFQSPADTAVAPMQDFLSLMDARMNLPGTIEGNWLWRMKEGALTDEMAARIAKLNRESHREAKI